MKPISDFVYHHKVEQLVALNYGDGFQMLCRDNRNALMACLALKYAQCRAWPEHTPPILYDMSQFMNPDLDRTSVDFEVLCNFLDELTLSESHLLLHALTQQEIEHWRDS